MTTISEEWARTAPAGAELDRACAVLVAIGISREDLG